MKISDAQLRALKRVKMWRQYGVYMPFAAEARSFEACEKKGLLEYRTVDQGHVHNGYALTEKGLEVLKNK